MIMLQERGASPPERKLGRGIPRLAPQLLDQSSSTLILVGGAPGSGRWAGLRG